MNILQSLQNSHSKTTTDAIIQYIGSDKKRLKELIDAFFSADKILALRAAWPLGDIGMKQPSLIEPYFSLLVKTLKQENHHPAITRNILRIFQNAEIPEKFQSDVLDHCIKLITSASQPPAIVAFAITTAVNISMPYPELRSELLIILNELTQHSQPPAIQSRLKMAFKQLK